MGNNSNFSAKELRERAWQKLDGNWSQVVVFVFVFFVATAALEGAGMAINEYLSSAFAVLILPMAYALGVAFLRFDRGGEAPQVNELFSVYRDNFKKSFCLMFLVGLFTALWTLLLIIPGLIMSYAYSMSIFVANDNPELSEIEVIKKSRALMDGHKMDLFLLDLSFIGWILLSIFTLGIGFLWVRPYMEMAHAEFYRTLVVDDDIVYMIDE